MKKNEKTADNKTANTTASKATANATAKKDTQAPETKTAAKPEPKAKPETKTELAKDKPETKTAPEKAQPTKTEPTIAELLDKLILKGGTFKDISTAINKVCEKRGAKIRYTKGTINGHIKYRIKQNAAYLGKLQVTEEGIA